jgi:CheY-like chemotaxis protein
LVVDDSPFNLLILHEIFGKVIPPKLGRDADVGEPQVLVDDAANGLQAFNKVKETAKRD